MVSLILLKVTLLVEPEPVIELTLEESPEATAYDTPLTVLLPVFSTTVEGPLGVNKLPDKTHIVNMIIGDEEQISDLVLQTRFVHILGAGLNKQNLQTTPFLTYLQEDGILSQFTREMQAEVSPAIR